MLRNLSGMPRARDSDRRPRRGWRLVAPLAFIAAGALLVTSAVSSGGTDLRAGSYADLRDLARQENERVQDLQAEVAALDAEIQGLSDQLDSDSLTELQDRIDELEQPAGLTGMTGPGLTVTLQDAPEEFQEAAGDNVGDTIVHQQDIQAVVNALWAGGAEAMTIQGQRVISTTGIKCVGNTVLLHGVTYSPPYVISAIGPVDRMRSSVESNSYVAAYLQAVDAYQLGWDLEEEQTIEAPAFGGTTVMQHAEPATDPQGS